MAKNEIVNPEIAAARAADSSEALADTMLDANDNAGINGDAEEKVPAAKSNSRGKKDSAASSGNSGSTENAEEKEEFFDVIFPLIEGQSPYFECSVNCIKYKYKRGVPVKVPRKVYKLYLNLNKDIISADTFKSAMPSNIE